MRETVGGRAKGRGRVYEVEGASGGGCVRVLVGAVCVCD